MLGDSVASVLSVSGGQRQLYYASACLSRPSENSMAIRDLGEAFVGSSSSKKKFLGNWEGCPGPWGSEKKRAISLCRK